MTPVYESTTDDLEEAAVFAASTYSPLDADAPDAPELPARRASLARRRANVRAPAAPSACRAAGGRPTAEGASTFDERCGLACGPGGETLSPRWPSTACCGWTPGPASGSWICRPGQAGPRVSSRSAAPRSWALISPASSSPRLAPKPRRKGCRSSTGSGMPRAFPSRMESSTPLCRHAESCSPVVPKPRPVSWLGSVARGAGSRSRPGCRTAPCSRCSR